MLQRVLNHVRASYPQVPEPDEMDRDDTVGSSMGWFQTGRGCELDVVIVDVDNAVVQTNYPGSMGGFDEFNVDEPALVTDIAAQFFPDEPRLTPTLWAQMKYAWSGQEAGTVYPHLLVQSSLISDRVKTLFSDLYPEVVASVPDPGTQWGRMPEGPATLHFSVQTDCVEFPQGEMQVAAWFNALKTRQPKEYLRWQTTFPEQLPTGREGLRTPRYSVDANGGITEIKQSWEPDAELLLRIYPSQPEHMTKLLNHTEWPIRFVAKFLYDIQSQVTPARILSVREIEAVTQRTRITFLEGK